MMAPMSWIALTSAHVLDRLASDELDAIEETGGGTGDRLTGIIAQVIAMVRAKVASCSDNALGPSGTIPDECLHAAATIAKHDLRATLPHIGGEDETEIRRDEYRDAMDFLKEVASCKIAIADDSGAIGANETGCYGGEPMHNF